MVKDYIALYCPFLLKEDYGVFSVGELVKWRPPLEPMFSYGNIIGFRDRWAVIECKDYYAGMVVEVHRRYVRKVKQGGKAVGGSK